MANVYNRQGKLELAIAHWRKAVELRYDFVNALNNLAWVLATTENEKVQNPTEAVKFAQSACEFTSYKQPDLLDTLAIAYADSLSKGINRFPQKLTADMFQDGKVPSCPVDGEPIQFNVETGEAFCPHHIHLHSRTLE